MRRAKLLGAVVALALAACGQHGRRWPDPHPALWQVTGPGGQHGWLFGTIHSLPEGATWRTRAIDDALDKANVLVVEIADLGDTARARAVFYRLSTTPGLPPLSQRVPPADRPALAALLKQAGVADDAFPATETWAAAIMLANKLEQNEPASGVDRALIAGGKRVVGLETFEQQYGVFDRLTPSEQAELLMSTTVEARDPKEDKEAAEWLAGDIVGLERDSATGVLAHSDLRQALQIDRNHAWDLRIEQMFADGEAPFVAVGAAHMFGPEGLPALLAKHGYTVKRVE